MSFEQSIFDYMASLESKMRSRPIILGGVSGSGGGSGGPPGGFFGYLPQTRVSYDTSELETDVTTISGSLLDNLNHIRYRLAELESTTVSGTGHIIQEEGSNLPSRSYLNFVGTSVTASDDPGNDATKITITVSGGSGSGDVVGPASSSNDTLPNFADTTGKLLEDSGVLVSEVVTGTGTAEADHIIIFATNTYRIEDSGYAIADLAPVSHNHAAANVNSGTMDQARLGTGSSGAGTKFLADDQTWKFVTTSGSGGGDVFGTPSATDGHVAVFDTDGYHIKDGGDLSTGHVIQNNGSNMTARANLNFIGATVEDDAGNNATKITITVPTTTSGGGDDYTLNIDGALATATDMGAFIVTRAMTLGKVYLYGFTLGASSSTIVDIHKNGTTVFTTQGNRPTLAYDDTDKVAVSDTPDITSLTVGDVLTVDIDQIAVGSSGLTVVITTTGGAAGGGPGFQTLSPTDPITWDLSLGSAEVTLSGDAALSNPTNLAEGEHYFLVIKQDDVGGRLLTSYGNKYKFSGGVKPILSVSPSLSDIASFECDGTNMFCVTFLKNLTGDFLPTTIADCVLWLRGSSLSALSNNDPVGTWEDESGQNNDATQGVSGEKPLYKTNMINGQPAVYFDDSDDGMVTGLALADDDPFTMFLVAAYADGNLSSGYHRILNGGTGNFLVGPYYGNWQTYYGQFSVGPALDTNYHYMCLKSPGSSGNINFRVDAANIGDLPHPSYGIGVLGLGLEGAFTETAWSNVAEVIVYRASLSDANRNLIEDYLSSKYGL